MLASDGDGRRALSSAGRYRYGVGGGLCSSCFAPVMWIAILSLRRAFSSLLACRFLFVLIPSLRRCHRRIARAYPVPHRLVLSPRLASSIDGTGFAAAGCVGGLLTGSGRALCLPRDAAAGVFCGRWRGCLLRLFHRVAWCGSVDGVRSLFPSCPVSLSFPSVPATISSVMRGSWRHRLWFSPYRSPSRIFDKIGGAMIASAWFACLPPLRGRGTAGGRPAGGCLLYPIHRMAAGVAACRPASCHHRSLFASLRCLFPLPFYFSRPTPSLRALMRSACVPCAPARRVGGRAGCGVYLLWLRAVGRIAVR